MFEVLEDRQFKCWLDNVLHRENAPAVIRTDGTEEYWINNKRHRIVGPSIITKNGSVFYSENGVFSKIIRFNKN